ncbi:hypothetical protein DVQ78_16255 [Yersinia enterocolitica]|nr:hypothetical protein [Yersinia enterocolitica]
MSGCLLFMSSFLTAHHDIIAEVITLKAHAMAWALSVLFVFFKLDRHFQYGEIGFFTSSYTS